MTQQQKSSLWAQLALAIMMLTHLQAAPLKIMTIGDSLTEEYYYEFPFSAPSSTPLLGFANTMNWVEILSQQRSADLDFGDYESEWPFGYSDWRQAGHEYNFGIPGYDTEMWMTVLDPLSSDDYLLSYRTLVAMRDLYSDMDVVVIMVGGNDVNFQYSDLYDATPGDAFSVSFIDGVITNLTALVDEVRGYDSSVPIVLANVPDLGATPDIILDHPDATKRANASAIVNNLNAAVSALAANRGLTLAPISDLTDQLLSSDPIYIGAHQMIKDKDPDEDNRPHYLFCWKGLHPSTNGQSVIANILIDAINTATSSSIESLQSREILSDLMDLDPDQLYLDWATAQGLTDSSMNADADRDGIPNIGEYLLDLNPLVVNTDHYASLGNIGGEDFLTMDYSLNEDAQRLVTAEVKYSTDLVDWDSLPSGALIDLGSNSYQVQLPIDELSADHAFMRMEFSLQP
ncbi:hypothetical protein JO972_13990 [Verrucomicrobiaceae bacterium 5K15]|uniref:SGNH hydrolase-type esterase domain-containing protein n=1 Tax=Oceaniferula flava TaxID=2800421 RepID=A0AAE2VA09_9BACT|nr:SGNH/GDSL hydrolase family protein [Oceaniferula flavus]MBK1856078.1 hypothetical protein [Oceaniferula flavus]MBM1137385.1 hypothetical protein [Oceaniferula flavus]